MSKFMETSMTPRYGTSAKPVLLNIDQITKVLPDCYIDDANRVIRCSAIELSGGATIQVVKDYLDIVLELTKGS